MPSGATSNKSLIRRQSSVERIGAGKFGGSPTERPSSSDLSSPTGSFPQGKRIVNSIHDSVSFDVDLDRQSTVGSTASVTAAKPAAAAAAAAPPSGAASSSSAADASATTAAGVGGVRGARKIKYAPHFGVEGEQNDSTEHSFLTQLISNSDGIGIDIGIEVGMN